MSNEKLLIDFTEKELLMLFIYDTGRNRQQTIDGITTMMDELADDETALHDLAASVVNKLESMTDERFDFLASRIDAYFREQED